MRRILITGGTGYLGTELLQQARAGAWEVGATSFSHLPQGDGVAWMQLDIRDELAVARALDAWRPDVVIHTAYRQRGPDLWSTSAEGAGVIARVARAAGARLIHMSSDALFDGERTGSYSETDDPSPITPYGEAKAAAERLVAEAHPAALIVRTSLIVGGLRPSKHERAATGPGPWFTNEIRSPVQVTDLAQALLELAEQDISGPLHVAGAEGVSRAELAALVARRPVPTATAPPNRPLDCRLDSSRAQGLIRTRLRGVREVLG